jgi:hypothetical protein
MMPQPTPASSRMPGARQTPQPGSHHANTGTYELGHCAEGFNMPHRWRTYFGFADLKLETAIEFLQPGFRDTTV